MKLQISTNMWSSLALAHVCLGALSVLPAHAQVASKADVTNCVRLAVAQLNWFLQNECPFRITVRWVDDGYCSGTCSADVKAMGQTSVTPIARQIDYVACVYPRISYHRDGRPWNGRGSGHECR